MISVAVVGAGGYVGSALCEALHVMNSHSSPEENKIVRVVPVTRDSCKALSREKYDVIINCATGSKRFWANQNPEQDFIETVDKTDNLISKWDYKKFIQISSVSARCELDSVYGKHKLLAEKLCQSKENCLIVRLTATYGPTLSKGVLIDILKGKVYVSGESRYAFSPLSFVTGWIAGHLDKTGLVEIGARNTISLQEVADRLNLKVEFGSRIENQEIQNPEESFPDAAGVLSFMYNMKQSRGA